MNKVKNICDSVVNINLPNVRFRTDIRPKQERAMPEEVFTEFLYDPGCMNMVRWGFLEVIYDKSADSYYDKIEVSQQTAATVNVRELLLEKTVKELSEVLKNASPALKDEIVAVAIAESIVDQGRCNIIKKYTDVDVLNTLAMARQE